MMMMMMDSLLLISQPVCRKGFFKNRFSAKKKKKNFYLSFFLYVSITNNILSNRQCFFTRNSLLALRTAHFFDFDKISIQTNFFSLVSTHTRDRYNIKINKNA